MAALATAGLMITAASACTAKTEVALTVVSPSSAHVTASVELTGKVADVLLDNEELMADLVDTFATRTGVEPKVSTSSGEVTLTGEIAYDTLAAAADITGVKSVVLTTPAGSTDGTSVTATVTLQDALSMREAIVTAARTQPDADAVAYTFARTTVLTVSIRFPGGLAGPAHLEGVPQDAVTQDDTTVTVTRDLLQLSEGVVVVTGNPTEPFPWWLVGVGGGVLAVAFVVRWAVASDRNDPRLRAR